MAQSDEHFFCFLPFPKQRNLWLSLERREQINELFILRLFPSFSFWLTINTYSFISFLSYPFVLHFPPTVRAVHTEWMCYKGKLLFIAFHFGTNCINFEWMTLKINCSIQKRGTSVSEEKSIFCKKLKSRALFNLHPFSPRMRFSLFTQHAISMQRAVGRNHITVLKRSLIELFLIKIVSILTLLQRQRKKLSVAIVLLPPHYSHYHINSN